MSGPFGMDAPYEREADVRREIEEEWMPRTERAEARVKALEAEVRVYEAAITASKRDALLRARADEAAELRTKLGACKIALRRCATAIRRKIDEGHADSPDTWRELEEAEADALRLLK